MKNLILFYSLLFSFNIITAQTVTDNFDDNSIDAAKWYTLTNLNANSSVTEINQNIRLSSRGHLVSQQEFEPGAGGKVLTITGDAIFNLNDEDFAVVTRSSGDNAGTGGLPTSGILILAENQANRITIREIGGAGPATTSFPMVPTTYNFTITDDGDLITFDFGGNIVTFNSSLDPANNYVSFTDRNINSSNHQTFLDNVSISLAPPTGIPTMGEWTLILFGLIVLSFGVVYVMRWKQFQLRNLKANMEVS